MDGLDVDGQVVLLLVDATLALLIDCFRDEKVNKVYHVIIVLHSVAVHEVVELHLLRNRKAVNVAEAYRVAHESEVVAESVPLGNRVIRRNVDKEVARIVGVRVQLHERVDTLSHHSGKKKIEGDILLSF